MEPTTSTMNKTSPDMSSKIGEPSAAEHARRSLDEARAGAHDVMERSNEFIRNSSVRAREALAHTTDQAAQYVQAQPLKSLLMALAAGAGIALLAGALGKSHHHHGRN